jgi:hypothetical protein
MTTRFALWRCTCTDDALNVVPLLLGYMSFEWHPRRDSHPLGQI